MAVLSFLVALLLFNVINSQTSSDICMWGRASQPTSYINGLYVSHGHYYEQKDSGCGIDSSLYLYYYNGQWRINNVYPPVNTDSIAKCDASVYLDYPSDCGGLWKVFNGTDYIADTSVSAISGSCPSISTECSSLYFIYGESGLCDECCGDFELIDSSSDFDGNEYIITTNNVFYRIDQNNINKYIYLYFNPHDYRWICSYSLNDLNNGGLCNNYTSSHIIAQQITPEFKALSVQQWDDITWDGPVDTAYMQCKSQAPTPTPTNAPTRNITLTMDDILLLKDELINLFDDSGDNKPVLSGVVRLVFNDCIGPKEYNYYYILAEDEYINNVDLYEYEYEYNTICDGCIDFKDSFHNGLYEAVIEPLEDIYYLSNNIWSERISLADFWVTAATIAIEYSIELSDTTTQIQFPFYFGRTDCSESPSLNINNTIPKDLEINLNPTNSFSSYYLWFEENLNFTKEETITIMGAHTLGSAHVDYTGYNGYWTADQYIFDNQFYINLLNDQWIQYIISDSNKIHWEKTKGDNPSEYNMLNTDISILYNIDDYLNLTSGEVGCVANKGSDAYILPDCPQKNSILDIIESYSTDNDLFLNNFKKVWMKLVNIGQDMDTLTLIEYTTTTTTPPLTTEEADYGIRNTPCLLYLFICGIITNLLC